jgi:siroheme synthase
LVVEHPAWRDGTTYVWLMAAHRLGALTAGLRERGFPADAPCLVVQDASTPDERSVRAPLGGLVAAVREAGIQPPAVVVVGRVVGVGVVAGERAA